MALIYPIWRLGRRSIASAPAAFVASRRSIGHPPCMRRLLGYASAALAIAAASAYAQYGVSPYHAGPPDVRNRYDKARDGGTVEQWTKLLDSDDPKLRLRAVEDLGESPDAHAVTPLLKAIGDSDMRVQ